MKPSFTKQEIRKLIKEVLQERWQDLFIRKSKNLTGKSSEWSDERNLKKKEKKHPSSDDLFLDPNEWVDTFMDDNGKYIGPTVGDFHKGYTFLHDPNDDITIKDLDLMLKWNEQYTEDYGLSRQELWKKERNAREMFMARPNCLGSFPT